MKNIFYFKDFIEGVQVDFSGIISGTENVDTIGYHVSRAIFDDNAFDDSRLGINTLGGGSDLYSIDSMLGHQFVEDPNALLNYSNLNALGGYMYKVNLRLGKTAIINIFTLKKAFPKTDPQSPANVQKFRGWLIQQGYGGIRFVGGLPGKLMNNTLCALSASRVRIRSVKNLKTGTELQSKNGPFKAQIAKIKQGM